MRPRSLKRCQVDGCDRAYYAKGHCQTHYARLRRKGTVADPVFAYQKPCSVPGCVQPQRRSGLCNAHSQQASHWSKPDRVRKSSLRRMEKFIRLHPDRYAFTQIQAKARARGKPWSLSLEQTTALITAPCHYCGTVPDWPQERNGIDRVDNAQGYVSGNCVPCCATCNSAKGTKTATEFEAWARRLYEHIQNHGATRLRLVP